MFRSNFKFNNFWHSLGNEGRVYIPTESMFKKSKVKGTVSNPKQEWELISVCPNDTQLGCCCNMAAFLKTLTKELTLFLYGVDLRFSIHMAQNTDLLTHGGLKHWFSYSLGADRLIIPLSNEGWNTDPSPSYSSGDEAFFKFLSFQYEYHITIIIFMCAKKEASWGIAQKAVSRVVFE